jgi:hypothetical protein
MTARMLAAFVQDLRFGARSLVRAPGYSIVGCLKPALGIGASIAVFTVMRSGVEPVDPPTLAGVAALLGGVATIADSNLSSLRTE